MSDSEPSQPPIAAPVHYIRDMVAAATLAEIISLLCRTSGRTFAHATSVVAAAEELLVFRDAAGRADGAYGFRFVDVPDVPAPHRLIHSIFSVVAPEAAKPRAQVLQIVQRTYGREHQQRRHRPILWAFNPDCNTEFVHCVIQSQPMRALAVKDATTPSEILFYTDRFAGDDQTVPPAVVSDVLRVCADQLDMKEKRRDRRLLAATHSGVLDSPES